MKSLKVAILSDVHTELYSKESFPNLGIEKVNLAIFCGDIGYPKNPNMWGFFKSIPSDVKIFVPGNHEYYSSKSSIQDLEKFMEERCLQENIVYLQKKIFDLGDFSFVGCTGWAEYKYQDKYEYNDFSKIRWRLDEKTRTRFLPEHANILHKDHLQFLKENVNEEKIVITHHPVKDNTQASLYIHGHTHECYLNEKGKSQILTNALGYAGRTNPVVKYFTLEMKNGKPFISKN